MSKRVELSASNIEKISRNSIEAAKIFNPKAQICIVYKEFTPRNKEDYDNLYIFEDELSNDQLKNLCLIMVSNTRQNLKDITDDDNIGIIVDEENSGRLAITVRSKHKSKKTANIAFSEFFIPLKETNE